MSLMRSVGVADLGSKNSETNKQNKKNLFCSFYLSTDLGNAGFHLDVLVIHISSKVPFMKIHNIHHCKQPFISLMHSRWEDQMKSSAAPQRTTELCTPSYYPARKSKDLLIV